MHTKPVFTLSLLSLLWMTACGAPGTSTVTAEGGALGSAPVDTTETPRDLGLIGDAQEVDPMTATDFLVWTRDADGHAVTHRLDGAGHETETLDGIFVATGAGAWQWREEPRAVTTTPCERYDDEGGLLPSEPTAPGEATRATLVHVASGAEQVVVDPDASMEGAADVEHGVELAASVGPYLFVRESTYAYTCGAHGNTGVSVKLWDAVEGTSISLPDDLGSLEGPRNKAIEALSDEDDDIFPANESTVTLTELVPTFGRDGALGLGLQFTAQTCYACTRGGWSSYTKSAVAPAEAMPSLLVPFARPPEAVRAFAASHPDLQLGGWSPTSLSGRFGGQ
jgi:hypothetical protein